MNKQTLIDYRGYFISLNKKYGCYEIYDKHGNYLKRTTFMNHGSLTDAKEYIDSIISRYGVS